MGLESLKGWQWALLGAALGAVVAYPWTLVGPTRDPVMRHPLTSEEFVELLGRVKTGGAEIRDLRIAPAEGGKNLVTGSYLEQIRWHAFVMHAPVPFVTPNGAQAADVRAYIDGIGLPAAARYHYPWWKARWAVLMFSAAAGLAIGATWSVVLSLLVGAGLGRKSIVEEKFDLSRYQNEPEQRRAAAAITQDDLDELQRLEDELARKLGQAEIVEPSSDESPMDQPVRKLESTASQGAPAFVEHEAKEYEGEYYPVEKPHRHDQQAFTLVELLVVIGIIAIVIAITIPTIQHARQTASVVQCASNLHQISLALQNYLSENRGVAFWRGQNLNRDGMDWYGYGGREVGNINDDPDTLFNRLVPRPLNKYVSGRIEIFRCPKDDAAPWTNDPSYTLAPASSQFEWVGNSYNFNANGYPHRPPPRHDGGLDGVQFSTIASSSRTVVFFDACLFYGFDWHFSHKANVSFADGHSEFLPLPEWHGEYRWDP